MKLNSIISGALLALLGFSTQAQVISHVHNDATLIVQTEQYPIHITQLNTGVFEIVVESEQNMLPSFALPENHTPKTAELLQSTDTLIFGGHGYTVHVDKATTRLSFVRDNEVLVAEEAGAFVYPNMRGFRFAIDEGEAFYGGGQRVLGMDRRGHKMPLYNRAHYGYTTESNQMYYSLPAVMSDQNYAILFDNSASGEMDIGADESNILEFTAQAGRMAYIVVMAEDTARLSQKVTQTTGLQPVPARWSMGNFASRFGYRSQTQTLDTAQKFRDLAVPLDAMVLDLYWFGPEMKGHMGNLNWDRKAWPEPEQMIAQLAQNNVKTVLITEPFILTTSKQWDNAVNNNALAKGLNGQPKRFDFFFGNTGLVDVFSPEGTQWFNQFYQTLADQGVAGWWGDLGEPEVHPSDSLHQLNGVMRTADELHNAYGHQWAKNVYALSRQHQPEQRPFIMMRAGFLGSQRFGMVPWTGDVSRSWGGLQSQVELSLQMSVFGLAYIHSDVGGFAGGEVFDPELYIRWTQHGVFSPIFRPHAQENIAPEPVFHPGPALEIARDYIQLRYSLMPYIYSMALENSLTGMPLMRPLSFYHKDAFARSADSYYFGKSFLVTPVTEAGVTEIAINLPDGVWFDYWSKAKRPGGQEVLVNAPLAQMPVHVKAGSFVPMLAEAPMHLDDYSSQDIVLEYYADSSVQSAVSTWYEDDGVTPDSLSNAQYQRVVMSAEQRSNTLSLRYEVVGTYSNAPVQRKVEQVIYGLPKPTQVTVDGQVLSSSQWRYTNGALNFSWSLKTAASVSVAF